MYMSGQTYWRHANLDMLKSQIWRNSSEIFTSWFGTYCAVFIYAVFLDLMQVPRSSLQVLINMFCIFLSGFFGIVQVNTANIQYFWLFLDIQIKYTYRSSHYRCSVKEGVIRNFAKLTGKHLGQRLFFNKVLLKRVSGTGVLRWLLRNF